MEIKSSQAMQAWIQAIQQILSSGETYSDRRNRQCYEIRNLVITITQTKQIQEPLDWLSKNQDWIFPELSDIAKIILTTKGIISSDYNYGLRLFSFSNQINQIDDYVIAQLKKDPLSRRAVCMLFNPLIDQKKVRGEIPCILSISFLLRNGKLHATAVIRSSDIFLGLPANLYQLFVISDYVAQKLGVQVGELTTISHSAHLYGDYQEQINKLLTQYAYK